MGRIRQVGTTHNARELVRSGERPAANMIAGATMSAAEKLGSVMITMNSASST
jgi:hypothetical protein